MLAARHRLHHNQYFRVSSSAHTVLAFRSAHPLRDVDLVPRDPGEISSARSSNLIGRTCLCSAPHVVYHSSPRDASTPAPDVNLW